MGNPSQLQLGHKKGSGLSDLPARLIGNCACTPPSPLATHGWMAYVALRCRGTMEAVDSLTDLVSQPELVDFGRGMLGAAHAGIMAAARVRLAARVLLVWLGLFSCVLCSV
jgi:hypothetical protein